MRQPEPWVARNNAIELLDGFIVSTRAIKRNSDVCSNGCRERIKIGCSLQLGESLIEPPGQTEVFSIVMMGGRVVGIEFDGSDELMLSIVPFPIESVENIANRGMSFGECVVQG